MCVFFFPLQLFFSEQDHVCIQASFKLVIKFLVILKVMFSYFVLDQSHSLWLSAAVSIHR